MEPFRTSTVSKELAGAFASARTSSGERTVEPTT
jgi:hypothetical protein